MKNYRLYICSFLLILILTGCKMGKKQKGQIEKKDKAPSALCKISSSLQEILDEVEEVEMILENTSIKENQRKIEEIKKADKGANANEKENSKKDNQESKEIDAGDEPNVLDRDEKLIEMWLGIDEKIKDVHMQWNLYEIEGTKKALDSDERENFGDSLNSLTKSIEERNIRDIYNYASRSMLGLAPIFNIYKDEIKGNINRIKYNTYQSYLQAREGGVTEGEDLLDDLENDLSQIRLKLGEDEKRLKVLDRTNLSIVDMKKSLKKDSIKLYRIKKGIVIRNLDELGE